MYPCRWAEEKERNTGRADRGVAYQLFHRSHSLLDGWGDPKGSLGSVRPGFESQLYILVAVK